ncbi:DedA family protein [Thermofilum sp.]|uniref:DedA family protein n=2 Tax=Thermofilum sp. TaxID=1961369 RepID=UPI00315EAFF1
MSLTIYLAELAITIISKLGLPGIFFLMTLESALIPIPSEAIMVFAGFLVSKGEINFLDAVLAGTMGNYVGSAILYFLGKKYGAPMLLRYGKYIFISKKHIEEAEKFFQKNGKLAVFTGRMLPAVRTVISLPAGIAKMDFKTFTVYTILGSIPWNMTLTYLGIVLGQNWHLILQYSTLIDSAAIIALIVLIAYFYLSAKQRKSVFNE